MGGLDMNELVYKVHVTRKMIVSDDSVSLHQAEGERIQRFMVAPYALGVFILNDEFQLTIDRVKRLERLLGSVFGEKIQVIY